MKPITAEELHPLFKPAYARGHAEGRAEARAEGRAKGRAEMLLVAIDAYGVALDEQHRARVLACRDLDQLVLWLRRSVRASSAEEIFGPE